MNPRANAHLGEGMEKPMTAITGDVCPWCGHTYFEGETLHDHKERRRVPRQGEKR